MKYLLDSLVIFGAKYLLFVVVVIAFVYFLRQPSDKQKQLAVFGLITCALVFIVARIASQLYYDPRPFVIGHFSPLVPHVPDNGFPSDHTLLASAIATVIFYFNRKVGVALSALAVLVGVARVMAGVHSPIDIIGSIIISAVVTFSAYGIIMPIVSGTKIYKKYIG